MVAPAYPKPERRLLLPGLLAPEPGLETYWVRAGGLTAVRLAAGDELTVIDRQGRQAAEITTLDPQGRSRGSVLGLPPDGPATVLGGLADGGAHRASGPADPVLAELIRRGLDPTDLTASITFGEWSPAGASETFTAREDGIVVVAAPGSAMRVDDDAANPPSDLMLQIRRGDAREREAPPLPEPLAEPVMDFRIDLASALSYEVKAGQFIQIIDVEGRQCSDFLAFDGRRLQDGHERYLDATATRYFMGRAYPQPGLFGKFYDQDMQPLVEVVQDTVGRHDTFGLACNRKYYEDMGYPGHVNCTDNFNEQLRPFGVAPRAGWPALNLFYNTSFDDHHQLVFDEPWSRPGDYVLLRAGADLVCASSACPDDIDPANGWVPTDVHVRVYDAERKFSMAIAHRTTPEQPAELTKRTAFHSRTSALTRQFTEYRGYWLPTSYDAHGAIEEYWACRERAAVMDLSPLRKFEVLGPDAEMLLQTCVTRNIRKLSHGQVVYSAVCNETGGMIDDCTVFRLGDHNFRFVGGDEYTGRWLREQAQRLGLDRVWVKHSTDQMHNIAVQGPASRDILSGLIWTPSTQPAFTDLTWFRFAIGRLGDHNGIPIVVSRTGYSGELGYELWCHPDDGPGLWDAVWDAGQPHGMLPLGLDALDILRIESGLVFAGYDFSDQVDPFEAGVGFTVPLKTKEDDFVGRDALLARKASPQRKLVGLELAGNEPAEHGDCVHVGRAQVGVVTSATRSPTLRKNIALCRMAVEHSEIGSEVEIGKLDGHQKRIPARVVRFPFYDPDKERPRA
ncbi:MAG: aminomethyltransferase family protein [Pseudonocardia sp.]|nr:aminomethyltransferase family protein [Pseudonocardia sp.]